MKMDPKDMTLSQRIRRKALRFHLAKLHWPRFNLGGVRALDFVHRYKSHYSDWTNEDHFNLMNMSHVPTFQNPGFADLGMTLNCPLQSIHESCTNYMVSWNNDLIGRQKFIFIYKNYFQIWKKLCKVIFLNFSEFMFRNFFFEILSFSPAPILAVLEAPTPSRG